MAKPRQFTEEFKLDAVRLARSSPRSMRQTASDLGIPQATLSRWLREARAAGEVAETLSADERTELVTAALDMAVARRRPGPGLVHHSDHGTQYTSLAFGRRLREAGIAASMGSVGDCSDNAMAESFFATLEVELIDRSDWATPAVARAAVFEYIEVFYNRIRRHSGIGLLSPANFEERYRSIKATRAV